MKTLTNNHTNYFYLCGPPPMMQAVEKYFGELDHLKQINSMDKALADWYANAKEIADFLVAANPENWPAAATESMMKMHIEQTTANAVDLLKNDYANAIEQKPGNNSRNK